MTVSALVIVHLHYRYDDTDSPEISDTNITINSEMVGENHLTLTSTGSVSSHTLNKLDSTRSLKLYKYFPRSRSRSIRSSTKKPPSSEILECITTSFNERIPTPMHIQKLNKNTLHTPDMEPEMTLLAVNNGHSITMTQSLDDQHCQRLLGQGSKRRESIAGHEMTKARSLSNMMKYLRPRSNSRKSLSKTQLTERKQETKAAKTLSAILLVFIFTWSPYMLCTMVKAFDQTVIPDVVYNIGEYLM